jgi:uncharacterized protein (TIGR00369 family)
MTEPENFQQLTGFRIVEWREGFALLELDLLRKHGNRRGVLHGGMATTLLDTACARALSWAPPDAPPRFVSTLSLTVNFLRPVDTGRVRAIGRTLPGGRRIVTCNGELLDAQDHIIAVCQGVFQRQDKRE